MRKLLAYSLLFLCAFSCNDSEKGKDGRIKVAFVTNCVAEFWTVGKAGALAGAEEADVDVEVLMPKDEQDQKPILEDLLNRQVAGIAVSPIDPDNQHAFLDTIAARTKLITHDSDAPKTKRLCYVGMDNYEAGYMCGELTREALPSGGKIMLFIGRLEQDNGKRRRQGTIDGILGRKKDNTRRDPTGEPITDGKYTILGTLTDQTDTNKAKTNAEDTLARYPEIDAMVGLFGYNPPACVEALRKAGKLGKVKIIAFDEAQQTLQGIKDGHIEGTIVQNPYMYGKESVRILAGLARGEDDVLPDGGVLSIPARRITKDNLMPFWTDLNEKLGKPAPK